MTFKIVRILDAIFSITGLIVLFPLLLLLIVLGYFDTGSPLFIQERVGFKKKPFTLVKFRTMSLDTESVASHAHAKKDITGDIGDLIHDVIPMRAGISLVVFVDPKPQKASCGKIRWVG